VRNIKISALLFFIIVTQHYAVNAKMPQIFTKKNIMMVTTLCSLAGTIFTFAYFKRTINLLKQEIEFLKDNAGTKLKVRFPNTPHTQELGFVLQQFATKEEMQIAMRNRTGGNSFDVLRSALE